MYCIVTRYGKLEVVHVYAYTGAIAEDLWVLVVVCMCEIEKLGAHMTLISIFLQMYSGLSACVSGTRVGLWG